MSLADACASVCQVNRAKAKGDDIRVLTLEGKVSVYEAAVDAGKITISQYLEGVQAAIQFDAKLARYLVSVNRRAEAQRVIARAKIMKQELANVEAQGGAAALEAARNAE